MLGLGLASPCPRRFRNTSPTDTRPTKRRLTAAPPAPGATQFVMGSLAMKATERDPDFLANMEKAVKNKRQQSEAHKLPYHNKYKPDTPSTCPESGCCDC